MSKAPAIAIVKSDMSCGTLYTAQIGHNGASTMKRRVKYHGDMSYDQGRALIEHSGILILKIFKNANQQPVTSNQDQIYFSPLFQ